MRIVSIRCPFTRLTRASHTINNPSIREAAKGDEPRRPGLFIDYRRASAKEQGRSRDKLSGAYLLDADFGGEKVGARVSRLP
jgi:hypothetical protein